jgi:diguanylate cyclase (GGDEF)-like protein
MVIENRRMLRAYMWAVVALATPLVWLAAGQTGDVIRTNHTGRQWCIVVVFCFVLIGGEMWPIPVARGEEAGDEITVSSTFGFALLLIAPVWITVAAQSVALTIDCIARRRPIGRLPFNIAQYAIAFVAMRATYAALAGEPFTPPVPVPAPHLLPAVVAGGAFLLVNNSLVAIAVAISLKERLSRVLVDDIRWQITTSAPLLGLGPLAAQAMSWTPLSIILLLVPIIALHHSGKMAMRREQQALRDSLTGLANRTMLQNATARALTGSTGQSAMLLLDLDHFKDINDTLGHTVGDQMLVAVADRLSSHSGPSHLVARLGGDEFVVLARGLPDEQSAAALAERLCAAVREPVLLHGVMLSVGCSVGIAFGPQHADNVSDLLRCADIALYEAKITRDTAAVYRKQDDRHSPARLGLQADLRTALENDDDTDVWVAFQPQYDLASASVTSVECLARWRHAELGDVSPSVFIPIAESTSLIDLLFSRVLDVALSQLAQWDRAGLYLDVCVNLSARQLSDLSLPAMVNGHLTAHGVAPHRLVLEVTESRLISNPERSAHIIRELQDLGVQISVDDFGTGYSSLSYLQRLAVDELKIDRSFTLKLEETGDDTIIRSTIELGHNLGLRVVAEGVETPVTADRLARMGCDRLQGYLIGTPVSARDLPEHAAASDGRWARHPATGSARGRRRATASVSEIRAGQLAALRPLAAEHVQ